MFEHLGQAQVQVEGLLHTREHLDRQQRVSAEIEEVIVQPDAVDAQDLAPDRRQRLLDRSLRRNV